MKLTTLSKHMLRLLRMHHLRGRDSLRLRRRRSRELSADARHIAVYYLAARNVRSVNEHGIGSPVRCRGGRTWARRIRATMSSLSTASLRDFVVLAILAAIVRVPAKGPSAPASFPRPIMVRQPHSPGGVGPTLAGKGCAIVPWP